MTKVLNLNHIIWPWQIFIIIEKLLIFSIFLKVNFPDVKFLLEQSHSKFYLYHTVTCNNLEKEHAFANPQVFKFQDETFFANKLKSWGILSYSLGTDELQTEQLFIISTYEKLNILKTHMRVEFIFLSYFIFLVFLIFNFFIW